MPFEVRGELWCEILYLFYFLFILLFCLDNLHLNTCFVCILMIKATTLFGFPTRRIFIKRSIERKSRQNVPIDSLDFPVSKNTSAAWKKGGKIVSKSRWFNTCVVQFSDSASIERIKLLPFVDSVKYV